VNKNKHVELIKLTIMKKMIFALVTMLTSLSASAMSYEQARNEALFLTDKMAYELNLTDAQYEAAYEINLDYLMGVTSVNDVFGTYWERRNLDLSYILYSWQWEAFRAASYFYRPLYWDAGYWHFSIYARYPHRDYFYFGRPHFYATYRGAHAWHLHGSHGYYHSHANHFRPALANGRQHFGMRNSYDRGDFRGSRSSSTRITGRHGEGDHHSVGRSQNGNRPFNDNRGINSNRNDRPSRSTVGSSSDRPSRTTLGSGAERPSRSTVGSSADRPSRSSSTGSSVGNRPMGGSSSSRSSSVGSSAPSRSIGSSSHSMGSRSAGSSAPSRSVGGSSGGSRSSGNRGGGHFGGSRR